MEGMHTNGTFKEYIAAQPDHVKQILGNLKAAEIEAEYWIGSSNYCNGWLCSKPEGLLCNGHAYIPEAA
eukprot:12381905-Ditylum_brightwellii.AAC.1